MFFRSTISFGFMRVEKEPIMNNLKKKITENFLKHNWRRVSCAFKHFSLPQ